MMNYPTRLATMVYLASVATSVIFIMIFKGDDHELRKPNSFERTHIRLNVQLDSDKDTTVKAILVCTDPKAPIDVERYCWLQNKTIIKREYSQGPWSE